MIGEKKEIKVLYILKLFNYNYFIVFQKWKI